VARPERTTAISASAARSAAATASAGGPGVKAVRLASRRLKRAFLGWLRGEREHCKMIAIPTMEDEDAKRPDRERESLVGEQTRIVNRMKVAFSRLGIRGFNPKIKKAAERLEHLRTPRGRANTAKHVG
jgi:transposase